MPPGYEISKHHDPSRSSVLTQTVNIPLSGRNEDLVGCDSLG